jgi:hypothetical protein
MRLRKGCLILLQSGGQTSVPAAHDAHAPHDGGIGPNGREDVR